MNIFRELEPPRYETFYAVTCECLLTGGRQYVGVSEDNKASGSGEQSHKQHEHQVDKKQTFALLFHSAAADDTTTLSSHLK